MNKRSFSLFCKLVQLFLQCFLYSSHKVSYHIHLLLQLTHKSPQKHGSNEAIHPINQSHIIITLQICQTQDQYKAHYIYRINVIVISELQAMASPLQIAKDLFCGCCSGWAQTVIMLPFENIKIKMVSKPDQYTGIIQAFSKTIKNQGILSFYKGMLFPLLGVGAQVSLQFGTVETLKKVIQSRFAEADGSLHWKFSVLCGVLSGIPSAIAVTPLDHSRFRVVLQKEGHGSVKTAINISKQYGLRKLYLGFNCTLLRQSFIGVYFGTYDFLKRFFTVDGQLSQHGSFLSGGIAGVTTWFIMYPVDYVKTRFQSDSLDAPKYKNAFDCFKQQLQSKGVKNLYVGFPIMLWRAFFVNAGGFVAFEFAKKQVF